MMIEAMRHACRIMQCAFTEPLPCHERCSTREKPDQPSHPTCDRGPRRSEATAFLRPSPVEPLSSLRSTRSSVEASLATRSESVSSSAMDGRTVSASAAPQRAARTNSPARLTQGELGRTQICAQLTLDFLFSRKDLWPFFEIDSFLLHESFHESSLELPGRVY